MNIKEFIRSNNFGTIIEIGTHFGTDTLDFKNLLPNCKIICFEPDPRNIKVIKKNWGDMEVADLQKIDFTKICNAYKFPEVLLNNTDSSTYNNRNLQRH